MTQFIDLGGTTPPMESCAQVGSREYDYRERAMKEAKAYINQIRRVHGPEPDGVRLSTKSHPHDFGTYYTVCVFHDDSESAIAYAVACDDGRITEWDDQARRELGLDAVDR